MALYDPVFHAYQPRFSPGLFTEYQPASLQDAKRYLDQQDRW
jgi:hypothetical protein